MDFDECDYLEKTVEELEDSKKKKKKKKKKKDGGGLEDKSERSYRKRDGDREEEEGDGKSSSKKSRSGRVEDDEERRDPDKDRHGNSRDRDRERERDIDRDLERRSSRERDKERERERKDKDKEKEREGRERSSSRSRRHESDREIERDRRERSSSRSRRHESDRELERERERDRRERSSSRLRRHESEREQERERDIDIRDSRRFKDKKDAVEPEADPERDQRTVFAYQMPLKATERDVYEFFSKAGKVRDVRLIMDRNSRRSKGVGYIEFYDVMSVPMAIALSGQLLLSQPVMVKPSEAEKNLVQSTTSGAGAGSVVGTYGVVDRKLYVGNLHFNMTEMQLRQIFEPFGPVELVQLPLDLETGQCKGFGFVQFAQLEHAKAAQSALNGKLEIAGRTIKVSSVTDHVVTQDTTAKSADFDDDEGGGLALNAQSRALLMQKLDRSGIATSITGSLGLSLVNGSASAQQTVTLPVNGQGAYPALVLPPIMSTTALDLIGQPSECLLLKNMFDPATETESDFDLDIKDDVEEECSKHGRVKHIYVDKNSAGCVYLRFDSTEAAGKAQRAMHMRWFAGRSISALFMRPHEYEARFKG
ncbi:ribonuclease P protein subunit p25-like protein-like [Hibiscus syriacus]|uniref:Ribonuclease P protein subunit p25-like protein-like n=1 Tax=Hibiscus syriacus TaxID=106335 RepID=A0A6A3C404_HIBSY|nr:RNA-binding protein 39-like isoform X1 [Hibiscus syriacus]KAE8721952.1 ribonuclease P protein subunit p25-like protein-like [Hibiscus syriacus]